MAETAQTPTPAPKRSRRWIFIIAAAFILLLGGGGAAYWTFAGHGSEGAAAEEAAPEAESPGAAIALEPFIVNLASSGRTHFLRVTLTLIVKDETSALEFNENEVIKMRVRSTILELLAMQTADRLLTPEGKAELKTAIAEGVASAYADLHVTDVLFSEFVVQF